MPGNFFLRKKQQAAPVMPPVKFRIRSSISTLLPIKSCADSINRGSSSEKKAAEKTDCLFFHKRGSPNPQGMNMTIFPTIFTIKTEK